MEWMPPPDGIECAIVMFPNVTEEEKAFSSRLDCCLRRAQDDPTGVMPTYSGTMHQAMAIVD